MTRSSTAVTSPSTMPSLVEAKMKCCNMYVSAHFELWIRNFWDFRFAGQVSSKLCEDEATILYATKGFFSRDCQEIVQRHLGTYMSRQCSRGSYVWR
ncbi:hypothetical protein ACE6H2_001434 [Prunus campanulata]